MENQQKPSKAIHISLWVAQVVLAALLVMGAVMKFMPIEKIAANTNCAIQSAMPIAFEDFC